MSNDPFIVCENLVRIYSLGGLEVFALQGLDLAVQRGEMLAIVGASGSGKSTLLNVIGGLDRPSAGRIWVGGQDLLKLSGRGLDHYRRKKVGFVWQQGTRNLVPYLNALENACLPMLLAGKSRRTARQRASMLLETVGLAGRLDHKLEQLSGGEQQRVAIAMALANQPELLLADEPTGEVDTASASVIYDLFHQVCHSQGITTVIVSHDQGISKHVDRVVAVRDGKLASETVRSSSGEHAQEMVVLDSAGRLQIPKDYLHRFNIQRRVLLETQEDGILIRPAAHAGSESLAGRPGHAVQIEELPEEEYFRMSPTLQKVVQFWNSLRVRISTKRRRE